MSAEISINLTMLQPEEVRSVKAVTNIDAIVDTYNGDISWDDIEFLAYSPLGTLYFNRFDQTLWLVSEED